MPNYIALDALLITLSEHIDKTEIGLASQTLIAIDQELKHWCESETPPQEKELLAIQAKILTATAKLKNARDKTQVELINQRKSHKAISKYKATKR
ncbi:hypothetical protein NH514_09120 [Pseudoalteromonas sp. ACER1]|uniref:hypothetical protein n=1 Tax=unclassified Pseudoalteromonas TaxID=194690 RepID=UPI001F48B075|nr:MULTISPECIES: hypothetical protein [unclassified Pseudoalteromonas]MCF2847160.1 hypothetical protein [Pseudoalteromonas sp. PAST1]MCO7210894.1 hypothetical protein [Pseudoalteromonas sp. ACER1]|tara:strand:+ start:894 stop:1181 length:288 start_codon:yes stop_codon:yes gene_type:complete